LSFPSGCEKWVIGHFGGVGPLKNEKGDIETAALKKER
jgi:hypothetical protein